MYYEINVSLNGKHLFATAERSVINKTKMKEVYRLFERKFPKSEGYTIDVTLYEKRGTPIINHNEEA